MEISNVIRRALWSEILTGIKALHKKKFIMGKYVMEMGTILKNGKQISIEKMHVFINSYNGNHMVTIT